MDSVESRNDSGKGLQKAVGWAGAARILGGGDQRKEARLLRRRQRGSLFRWRGASDEAADAGRWASLCQAALTGEGMDVEALLAELRTAAKSGSPRDRGAALHELLKVPPVLWLHLDRFARVNGEGVGRYVVPVGTDLLWLLVASLDRDGRIRQDAVHGLADAAGPLAVSALVLRTADWVAPVRDRAVSALNRRTAPDEAAAAVRLLVRLRGRSRAGGVAEAYGAVLSAPERRRAVRSLAADEDSLTRRFGVELALRLGEHLRGDLLRTALRDPDQVCRRLCAQRLLEIDPEQAGRLMRSRSAQVRELAVAALPEDVPTARLVWPLADRARLVRVQARLRLTSRGEPPVDVYRRQLRKAERDTPARLVAGLATGLGECGDVTDVPLLLRLAESRPPTWTGGDGPPPWTPVVRRCAVRAAGRLALPDELIGLVGRMAMDPDPGVAREAIGALARAEGEVPAGILWFARNRPEPYVRRAAERLVQAGPLGATPPRRRGTGPGM
jgi:HEAT repeat protein